jgi:hypothetical protein
VLMTKNGLEYFDANYLQRLREGVSKTLGANPQQWAVADMRSAPQWDMLVQNVNDTAFFNANKGGKSTCPGEWSQTLTDLVM